MLEVLAVLVALSAPVFALVVAVPPTNIGLIHDWDGAMKSSRSPRTTEAPNIRMDDKNAALHSLTLLAVAWWGGFWLSGHQAFWPPRLAANR
jgi:hypothetical protein